MALLAKKLIGEVEIIVPGAEEEEEEKVETITFDVAAAQKEYSDAMRHHLTVHFLGKTLEKDVLDRQGDRLFPAGTLINEDIAEKILSSDIPQIAVRMDAAEGVEVRKITEAGGLIESLADRISGRSSPVSYTHLTLPTNREV